MRCLRELERSQWLKPEEIDAMQHKGLSSLLEYSYHNVPYYRRIFKERGLKPEDVRTKEDLTKLPILTKKDVKDNFYDLVTRKPSEWRVIETSTSGTTGKPFKFYTTEEQLSWENAAGYRMMKWYGFDVGHKLALIWAMPFDYNPGKVSTRTCNLLMGQRILNCYGMSKDNMSRFARDLKKFRPDILKGYSSGLHFFAEFLECEGIDVNPKTVVSCAEQLFDYQRLKLKEVFQCEVYDFYAAREATGIASECPKHHGYHIHAENQILEFVRDGEQVSSGETGAILITNLRNYAMPFVRYEIGDLGEPSDECCSCGRGLPLMRRLEGRSSDIIATKDGRFTSSPSVHYIVSRLPVTQYQIIQESYERIRIKIVTEKGYSERHNREIIRRIRKNIGDFDIDFEFVDSIPLASSGKRRVVVSKVPLHLNWTERSS